MIIPEYLHPGDKVAIISPATEIKEEYIDGAEAYLSARGYNAVVMPHARGPRHGTYAASDAERLADLYAALTDPDVRLIFCARGGYGCVHLLRHIPVSLISANPKWLAGFSDISALHALWQRAGVVSLHCSMAKQLTLYPDSAVTESTMGILEGSLCTAENPYHVGRLTFTPAPDGALPLSAGGNLAVLNGLAATEYDILSPDRLKDRVLFLEDVGEKIYQVERMLTRLYLSGALSSARGLVFGQFTDYSGDRNYSDMEQMIESRLAEWQVTTPYITGAPFGHTDGNMPLPLGVGVAGLAAD
ncbi:MAG: LD-carboxypeptidase [Muribaculaceae bacterium]|nr:LD-carboxypeptidase [Muribaculaceae bacterium]